MKPDEIKRYSLLEISGGVSPYFNAAAPDKFVFAADHDRVVDYWKQEAEGIDAAASELESALRREIAALIAEVMHYTAGTPHPAKALVDALRKERDVYQQGYDAMNERIYGKGGESYELKAATARCERLEKAIQTIVDLGDCDDSASKMYWIARHAQYAEAKAIAEQSLADGEAMNRGAEPT